MSRVVRVAVVGYGGMGGWHTRLLQEIPEVELAGVYDILPERNKAAEEAGIKAYDSLEALLADETIDVVTVAIPNDLHEEVCIKVMEAGKAAISEKPVTMSTAVLENMIAASNRTGSLFTVHQNRRWDEDFRTAEKIYKSGDLGRVFEIQSRVHGSRGIPGDWRNTKAQGGGMVLDWGVHLLDQMNMMMGKMPVSVYAVLSNVTNEEVDDGFTATFKFDDGLVFTVEVGTSNFINLPRWYILGLNGTSVIEDWDVSGRTVIATCKEGHDAVPIVTAAGLTKTMAPRTPETIETLPIEKVHCDIKDYYRNIAAVVNGEAEQIVTHDQQRDLMKLMEAIFESAEKNEVVFF
ncbi:Gfo/Idh/MocA family protein [Scatolibacter rhodanostii]|uniref:Gfo/Idh/MocA family protein n=1 Tax=Scatolibacter rhodanostii TaxID=2014781 RepID=UPI000C072AA2|nr:Gfo/Idh/MocA family oxidoreductase [Scatolibacter rhodanostii]